ncbi:restriction endonuclease [Calycomorphotria hydatis]|nr:restriction endonuclease [Calycomorphotria hydatis]
MDNSFHFPAELFQLLVEAIPRLVRSKQDVLVFFEGCGIPHHVYADLSRTVSADRDSITKFEICRKVLLKINREDDKYLRERREVLRRVTSFEDYSVCWPGDALKAKGLVADIRKLINVKDSFTRMKNERDAERRRSIEKREREIAKVKEQYDKVESIKKRLYSLFTVGNAQVRGKQLEVILNELFSAYEIAVRQSFTRSGEDGEGIIEQVDGVVEFDGHLSFVEMKWWKEPIGKPEVSEHLVRVFTRAETRAIIISASEFTSAAIVICKEALSQKVVTLVTLEEITHLLENQLDLLQFLRIKFNASQIDKDPCFKAIQNGELRI